MPSVQPWERPPRVGIAVAASTRIRRGRVRVERLSALPPVKMVAHSARRRRSTICHGPFMPLIDSAPLLPADKAYAAARSKA